MNRRHRLRRWGGAGEFDHQFSPKEREGRSVYMNPMGVSSLVNDFGIHVGDKQCDQSDVLACAVCGKNVQGERGFARVSHKGTMVNLRCLLCLETPQKDPAPFLARLVKAEILQELKAAPKR